MSGTDRQEQYQAWIEGRGSKVMVATSAFSTGNDYPHVRLVLHLDKPFDMLDYIQGQGRAGRDGMPAICHTLVPGRPWKESRKQEETERRNEQAALDHLYLYGSKRCLRYGATLFTDGKGVGCHEDPLNQRCSVCKSDPDHRPRDIRMASIPSNRGADAEASSSSSSSSSIGRVDHPGSFSQAARQVKELRAGQEMGTLGRA
ncbi:P-loop containing nucleoside triphosphate hydrolase protein [Pisolithus sp. B1]|nr:P-loop containing nucleoside triphosphate hydrolase protein [Pisolithus sp. B1]